MSTVNLDNLTPDDLLALDARIKDLRAQREAAATAAADTPQPTTFAPPSVNSTTTIEPTHVEEAAEPAADSEAKEEATPESLLAAIGVAQTPDQLANAKAWIESHLGITLP